MESIFPPFCWECQVSLENTKNRFCKECSSLLYLLNIEGRCQGCFQIGCVPSKCLGYMWGCSGVASALEYNGPIMTLIKKFKYEKQFFLAKSLASWLVLQFNQLNWPDPDYVIPVPQGWLRRLERGYNQSALLAKEFVSILNIGKVSSVLSYSSPYHNHSGTSRSQRMSQINNKIKIKKTTREIEGKRVLLIDDVRSTGETVQSSVEALWGLFPSEIYVLTLSQVEALF
jgi:competence protein ComFC